GGLPSVPRSAADSAPRATGSSKEPGPGKEKDATMAQSPPPASGSASGRGARPASSGSPALPGLPPSPTSPRTASPAPPAAPASGAPRRPPAAPAPAGPPAPAAPAGRPQPPAGRPARRAHSDSVTEAFDQVIEQVIESEPGDTAVMAAQSVHGVSTVEDLAE